MGKATKIPAIKRRAGIKMDFFITRDFIMTKDFFITPTILFFGLLERKWIREITYLRAIGFKDLKVWNCFYI
jgi:hypothetical protein